MEFSNPALAPLSSFAVAGWPDDSTSAPIPWLLAQNQTDGMLQRTLPAATQQTIDPVEEGHDFIRGDAKAPVTLVAYGNYFCRRFAAVQRVIDDLTEHYGTRLLRVVFRHLPLRERYPNAALAAEAAEIAAARGKFWEMHSRLLAAQHLIEPGFLTWHAAVLGLDTNTFQRELNLRIHAQKATRHDAGARRAGISDSPTLFINGLRCRTNDKPGTLRDAVASAMANHNAYFFGKSC